MHYHKIVISSWYMTPFISLFVFPPPLIYFLSEHRHQELLAILLWFAAENVTMDSADHTPDSTQWEGNHLALMCCQETFLRQTHIMSSEINLQISPFKHSKALWFGVSLTNYVPCQTKESQIIPAWKLWVKTLMRKYTHINEELWAKLQNHKASL